MAIQRAGNKQALHDTLKALDEPSRELPSALHGRKVRIGQGPGPQRVGEEVGRRDRVLELFERLGVRGAPTTPGGARMRDP